MSRTRVLVGIAIVAVFSWGSSCPENGVQPEQPVPTTLELNQSAVNFAALGATQQVTATVRDQNGQVLAGQAVAWSSGNTGVASVNANGVITAVGNGSTNVTATVASLSQSVAVTVVQVATALQKTAGDGQSGPVNQALTTAAEVQADDARGNPVAGVAIDFAVVSGGGMLDAASGTTGAAGRTSVNWTLGTTSGPQSVSATIAGSATSETFTATALAAAIDTALAASGDAQIGVEGTMLPNPLVVRLADRFGNARAGDTVAFAVTMGGGMVSSASVVTDPGGEALTNWTLGMGVGTHEVTATVDTFSIVFTATATAAPATVTPFAGNGQMATVNTSVPIDPAVLVQDAAMAPVQGVQVVFTVTGGGGSVTGDTVMTDASGIATVGSWTLGTTAGAQELTATAMGSTPAMFTATATPDAANAIAIVDGDNQTGLVGTNVNISPTVRVEDQFGNGVQGQSVMFAVTGGSGMATGTGPTTNTAGEATVGSWTLGPGTGANQLTASSGALTPVAINATGINAAYNVDVRPIGTLTAPQQEAFDSAEARWERVVIGDVQDIAINLVANACLPGQPTLSETVDDVIIYTRLDSTLDGPGGTLGFAGPCVFSARSSNQTVVGIMFFDAADVATLIGNGTFDEVILHEMGHVLGIGTLWPVFGLLADPSLSGGTDPHFTGPRAIAAFDSVGGTVYTASAKVPVENTGGQGTADGHWRETVLKSELMTGFLTGSLELSVLTIASLLDMNYIVNYNEADPFMFTFPLLASPPTPGVQLINDIWQAPELRVDADGWIRPVRRGTR